MVDSCFICTGRFGAVLADLANFLAPLSQCLQLDWLLMLLISHNKWVTRLLIVVAFLITGGYIAVTLLRQNVEPAPESPLLQNPFTEEEKKRTQSFGNESLHEPLFHPPLRTRGRHIVDASGKRFKLASVNWYGASDESHTPGGLDVRHRDDIARTIRLLGFNSVRLVYADQMVRDNILIPKHLLEANSDLVGSRALTVFEAVVNSLTNAGLAVIINNHITQCRWCCDGNVCDAIWTNSVFGLFCAVPQTEDNWIDHWETIMRPHVGNPFVVGADLRNEPRGLFWGLGWMAWVAAAERLGERLLKMQPNWLMIVEGTHSANYLARARFRPVRLSVENRLVYSAHVYGWSGWGSLRPYWGRKYESFSGDMRKNWGYLLEEDIAPVWVGEFGAPRTPGKGDLHYWKNLMRYMSEADVDFAYWAINPRKPKDNEVETYSLVEDDWETPRWDYRLYDMARLIRQTVAEKAA